VSLLDVVRSAVKIADKVTKPLQGLVSFERYLSQDGFGTKTYATPATLRAIVELKQQQVRSTSGELSVSRASVLFLDVAGLKAVAPSGVSVNDRVTLPDGTTGPILNLSGFVDAGTTHAVATQVFLG